MRLVAMVFLSVPLLVAAQDEEDFRKQIERMLADRESKEFETDHYKLTAGKASGEILKAQLEDMFAIWSDALKTPAPANKLVVTVHRDEEDYKKDVAASSLAHYDPEKAVLFGLAESTVFNNLVREGTHQFLHQSAPKAYAAAPAWLRAGSAIYFGSVDVGRDKKLKMNDVFTRENYNNAMTLKKLIKDRKTVAARKLVDESDAEFAANVKVREVQAWGLVWYLANGSPGALAKLVAALEAGKARDAAYAESFPSVAGKVDWMKFDADFAGYWKNLKTDIADREEGDWLVGETEHYTVRVQKGAKNAKLRMDDKAVLKDMKFKMELLFEKYALAFRFEGKLSKRPQMRLYKNRQAYINSGAPGSSAAYYNPSTKELVGYEDSEETGIVFQIFCHEGCHQFFDLAFPGFYDSEDLPMWFSEGLADCFGSSEIVGKDLVVFTLSGVATWRADTIKEAISRKDHPSIRDLLDMGREPFMRNGGLHYAQSWSFCHFLWNSPNQVGGGGKYKDVVIRLIDGFKVGKPKDVVYREAFQLGGKPLDLDQLESEWKAYMKTVKTKATKR